MVRTGELFMSTSGAPENGQRSKAKVFISYSRKDIAFADRLEVALKARGFEVLFDREEIYAFEEWWTRIETLIACADTVVFVLSPDAVASEVALKEVAFAASLNKRFAPIVCRRVDEKAMPQELSRLNFIFFNDAANFEANANRLAEALATDIGWIRQHTEFGQQARRWDLAKAPVRAALASAHAGGSRALDRVAAERSAGADRGDASLHPGQPPSGHPSAQFGSPAALRRGWYWRWCSPASPIGSAASRSNRPISPKNAGRLPSSNRSWRRNSDLSRSSSAPLRSKTRRRRRRSATRPLAISSWHSVPQTAW